MMYVVTAARMRPLVKNEKGKMVPGKRLFKGDTIDLPEEEAARLVRQGGLRLAETEEDTTEDAETVTSTEGTPEDDDVNDEDGTTEDDSEEESSEVPDLSEMSYGELQALAKEVTGNGGGSREDLEARLTEHYAQ